MQYKCIDTKYNLYPLSAKDLLCTECTHEVTEVPYNSSYCCFDLLSCNANLHAFTTE